MLRWYLVHTKPLSEAIAQANLERQGYQVYLPRLAQSVLGRHPRRERITPLFPRYLFLRLREGSQPLGPVRSSVGVRGVVRFGFRYAVVADDVICRLQARADDLRCCFTQACSKAAQFDDAVVFFLFGDDVVDEGDQLTSGDLGTVEVRLRITRQHCEAL